MIQDSLRDDLELWSWFMSLVMALIRSLAVPLVILLGMSMMQARQPQYDSLMRSRSPHDDSQTSVSTPSEGGDEEVP